MESSQAGVLSYTVWQNTSLCQIWAVCLWSSWCLPPPLSPSSVRVCSRSFPQNSPLEVDDEGFVIRADSTQNDILLLLLHSGPGKTIKEYFCFEPVIKNNWWWRQIKKTPRVCLVPPEKPHCSRKCFEINWKRGFESSVTRYLIRSRCHQLRVTFNNLCPKESSVIFFLCFVICLRCLVLWGVFILFLVYLDHFVAICSLWNINVFLPALI